MQSKGKAQELSKGQFLEDLVGHNKDLGLCLKSYGKPFKNF